MLLLFATLTAEKCTPSEQGAGGTDAAASVFGRKWVLNTLNGNRVTMPDGTTAPWLMLGADGNAIEGHGGCNSLMGTFTLEGERISFPGLGSTKKFCAETMPTENAFLAALKRVDQYVLEGGTLKLLGAGAELAVLVVQ